MTKVVVRPFSEVGLNEERWGYTIERNEFLDAKIVAEVEGGTLYLRKYIDPFWDRPIEIVRLDGDYIDEANDILEIEAKRFAIYLHEHFGAELE